MRRARRMFVGIPLEKAFRQPEHQRIEVSEKKRKKSEILLEKFDLHEFTGQVRARDMAVREERKMKGKGKKKI